MTNRKKVEPGWLLVPILMFMFLFAIITWLSTPDTYSSYEKTYTITGWEVLRRMYPSFWGWVWAGVAGALIFSTIAYCNESGAWFGKKLRGTLGMTIACVVLALACFVIPWIPAMDAKVNGGATLKQTETSHYENTRTRTISGHLSAVFDRTDGVLPKG